MQLSLPIETGILIPADDSVRLLSQVMEELDYSKLYQAYSRLGRNPAVSPKNLFKVLVYGYMNNIYSSRGLETACRRDINFMWLLQGQASPDHNTIARFRSERLTDVVDDLFRQLVEKLHEYGEIAFANLFVDGTKIEASANKYSFVWKKAVTKNEVKLQAKAKAAIDRITGGQPVPEKIAIEDLRQLQKQLQDQLADSGVQLAHGKGQHKTQLQRDYEEISGYLERQEQYNHDNSLFDGRNSFSKTDTDATFMHMKEDHMRNSQLKPGYNVQIGVEGEYVVGIDISSERSDQLTLIPFLEKLQASHSHKHQNIVADAGYESEENYIYLAEQNYTAYIKPQNYEQSKTRQYRNDPYRAGNMAYDEVSDTYTCPQGRLLLPAYQKHPKSKSGYISTVQIYECQSCDGCPVKSRCTKAAGNRHLQVAKTFLGLRQASLDNITSPFGILLRMNRSIQVEGAFGVLKEDYGFRRFLLRGKKNVRTEYTLLCMGYNLNKLHNKIQNKRCQTLLHSLDVA
ncbi:MAG: IS1182 family transposase [Clostridiaceae bacterium]|nr:IS1182 family transposase [Clostridiaceae bacterium]